ncbi:uncharacterized protein LOC142982821 [Anticarsia gemmatalis]|uniref:uncharacterized protein LOC142982821 n=1 Tax=Anticarsia gemmatalis TaxID=129554 RepID=UPI003F7639A7
MPKSYTVTILHNSIDQDVQTMLYPLNLMQTILFGSKYRIKDGFISPNSGLTNFILLCGNISFILAFLYHAERRLCKNIKRLYRTSFDKMSLCGLFYIDAVLPLCLMSLLTNYTVVLLQFAFL